MILGVLDEASTAKQQLLPKVGDLRAYEQVEWTRAVSDHWLAVQAYEGSLRAIEGGDPAALFAALCAKESVAELAEVGPRPTDKGDRRGFVLAAESLRPLVRRRPGSRLPAAAMGPRLRHPLHASRSPDSPFKPPTTAGVVGRGTRTTCAVCAPVAPRRRAVSTTDSFSAPEGCWREVAVRSRRCRQPISGGCALERSTFLA